MNKIVRSPDCGNSPKNIFVQEMSIALASQDLKHPDEGLADDVRWRIVGRMEIAGRADLLGFLGGEGKFKFERLTICHVVTHGKAGAVNGAIQFEGGPSREFCDVYGFTNAKGTCVQAITSYVVDGTD